MFSARDAYAWTSTDFPGDGERVGTYTFFGYHDNREFEYIVCDETFGDPPEQLPGGVVEPDPRIASWIKIISTALEQWENATNGFVTVEEDKASSCSVGPRDSSVTDYEEKMREFIDSDNSQNEVRMFDLNAADKGIYSFPEFKSDVFKVCLDEGLSDEPAAACVTSFLNYSGLDSDSEFLRIAISTVDEYLEGRVTYKHMVESLIASLEYRTWRFARQASNTIKSVDISFKRSSFADDRLHIPSSSFLQHLQKKRNHVRQ